MIKTFFENWVIPNGYLKLRRDFLLRKRENEVVFKENVLLKNKESEKSRCFILATGPSLSGIDLSGLKDELCISVSNFFVHDQISIIKPQYHVFAPSHPPITSEQYAVFLEDAFTKMRFNCNVIVYNNDRHIVNAISKPNSIKLFFYRGGGRYPVDLTKSIPDFRTVVHPAIYLALYLGVRTIYLLGVDHSWALHYGNSQHFYEEQKSKLVAQNYNEWRHSDIGKLFEGYGKTWDIYRKIRDYSAMEGVEIVNLNTNSVLDIFPRRQLGEVVGIQ